MSATRTISALCVSIDLFTTRLCCCHRCVIQCMCKAGFMKLVLTGFYYITYTKFISKREQKRLASHEVSHEILYIAYFVISCFNKFFIINKSLKFINILNIFIQLFMYRPIEFHRFSKIDWYFIPQHKQLHCCTLKFGFYHRLLKESMVFIFLYSTLCLQDQIAIFSF